ncbi:MAG: thiamine pyrophosphate-dependent enzyme [Bacteroidota bacterium]|nr:thiamine pyrophosphate-dependent enzyme [Bacteroidota bacterium]
MTHQVSQRTGSPVAVREQQAELWRDVARLLLLSRRIDEVEERELLPAGKITYQFSAKGHELAQIVLGLQLRHPHDGATVYYRSRPFLLAVGLTPEEAFAGSLAKVGSPSGGRDIGVVFNMPARQGVTVLPASGDVGAQYTPAAGWAQAILYRQRVLQEMDWVGAIAVALGGDGSVATNGFWSALNIATTLTLPMLFFIENNGYGISVPSRLQIPGGRIVPNLRSFGGLRTWEADGTDPEELAEVLAEAIPYVRSSAGPALVEVWVPRLCGHSSADTQSYKAAEEREREQRRDPLHRLRSFLIRRRLLSVVEWKELEQAVEAEARTALDSALAQPEPQPHSVRRFLFFEPAAPQQVGGLLAEGICPPAGTPIPQPSGPRINMVEAIRRVLHQELERNPRVLVFGEDVGVKGGVHGATVELQRRFGSERVFDTSLSEEGIIGRAVGMALAGLVPVAEIQFRKYADPATEQLNDCGTIRWRTNGRFAAPVIVRIPVGFSKVTGDPWHSVCGEAVFAHTPGWRVAFPANAEDAAGLLRTALWGNDPVLFFEHRALYDTPMARRPYPGDAFVVPFGQAAKVRAGSRATVVTWGAMLYRVLEAVEQLGVDVEVIDLRTLVPWDVEAVVSSVRKTNRCLIVHEDTWTCGFGAEIVATLTREAFQWLDAPVERVASPDCPVPYNHGLMDAVVPTVECIVATLRNLLDF